MKSLNFYFYKIIFHQEISRSKVSYIDVLNSIYGCQKLNEYLTNVYVMAIWLELSEIQKYYVTYAYNNIGFWSKKNYTMK